MRRARGAAAHHLAAACGIRAGLCRRVEWLLIGPGVECGILLHIRLRAKLLLGSARRVECLLSSHLVLGDAFAGIDRAGLAGLGAVARPALVLAGACRALLERDFGAQALDNLLARELLHFLASGGAGHEVYLADSGQFGHDDVAAAVAIQEDGDLFLLAEFCDGLRHIRAAHSNHIGDVVLEHVDDIGAAFHQYDGILGSNAGAGRQFLGAVFGHLGSLDFGAHLLGDFLAFRNFVQEEVLEQRFGAVDENFALCRARVLDFVDAYAGFARADAVHGFKSRGENARLDHVE